jgi:hypothetical protein
MNKQRWMIGLLSALALMVFVSPSDANFVQCPGGACGTPEGSTNEADVINGTQNNDDIMSYGGDDFIFGSAGMDFIISGAGDDIIFGGLNSDLIDGTGGNDFILPGPDDLDSSQEGFGLEGNDIFNVFVGEIVGCMRLYGQLGHDVVNFIGFGPYSANSPFGIPDFELGWILIVDPITGGLIFVEVSPDAGDNTEVMNGLPTPNPTFLTDAEFNVLYDPDTGSDPCPAYISGY